MPGVKLLFSGGLVHVTMSCSSAPIAGATPDTAIAPAGGPNAVQPASMEALVPALQGIVTQLQALVGALQQQSAAAAAPAPAADAVGGAGALGGGAPQSAAASGCGSGCGGGVQQAIAGAANSGQSRMAAGAPDAGSRSAQDRRGSRSPAPDASAPSTGAAAAGQLNAPVVASGASASVRDNARIVAEVAAKHGVDPVLAVAVMLVESGGNNRAVGDNGTSFGLFQLHKGGMLTSAGLTPSQAYDPRTNAEVALKSLGAELREGGNRSPGRFAADSQRPADKAGYERKVNASMERARSILGGG